MSKCYSVQLRVLWLVVGLGIQFRPGRMSVEASPFIILSLVSHKQWAALVELNYSKE